MRKFIYTTIISILALSCGKDNNIVEIQLVPTKATLVFPDQNTVTLEWKGSDLDGDILEYDVYFGDSDPPTLYQKKYKQTILPNIPLVIGKSYYWKIITRDSLGNESTSGIFRFEVGS